MIVIAVGMLTGIMLLHQLAALPPVACVWLLVILVPLLIGYKRLRFPLVVACGFLWALLQAHAALYPGLHPALEGEDLVVTGVIASIPELREPATRFLFDIEQVHTRIAADRSVPERARLSWYNDAPALKLGQRWKLTVRLARPRGFMNPGGFDYEGWLYSQGIGATGYIRDEPRAQRLPGEFMERPVGRLRQAVADAIARRLGDSANTGVITALAIGDRGAMTPERWQLLLDTGTSHLLAISGMNISLVAGMVYFLTLYLWRLSGWLCLRLPATRAAAFTGLIAGISYALLAGFSIPTQRAVIMLTVVMGALMLDRIGRPGHTLAIALTAVLVWSSAAVLSAGFWLSFAAVGIIVYSLRGRPQPHSRWRQSGRLQGALTIGLAPLTLFFFQRAPLISFFANLVAVPWIGLVIGPLVLVAVALLPVAPGLAGFLLDAADYGLDLLWRILEMLAALPFAQWHQAPVGWTLLPAALGMIWLLAPRGWPARWLGLVLLLPMAMVVPARPAPGGYTITLLDVGQGLAAVIETRRHVLVYDTGPRFSDYFNAGDAAVIPYLRRRGVKRIDTLVISHGDNDHSGGAAAVLAAFPVTKLLTSAPRQFDQLRAARCHAGQRWRSDGVTFEILHPSLVTPASVQPWPSTNNRSCVLRVASAGGAVLLPGDIEADAERTLVHAHVGPLASDVLVMPHHGSATSSSAKFIDAVGPELALVSTAYGNQWGFPAPEVLARYRRRSIPVKNTAGSGALTVTVHPRAGIALSEGYRQSARHFWTAYP